MYEKEKMNDYMKNYNDKTILCSCGKSIRQAGIYKHQKTIKHLIKVGDFEKLALKF